MDAFQSTVELSSPSFMVATRVQDFGSGGGCRNGAVVGEIDERYSGSPGYAGWATFAYRHYLNPSICPTDLETGANCCCIP